jgi:hypothetical protein
MPLAKIFHRKENIFTPKIQSSDILSWQKGVQEPILKARISKMHTKTER